VGSFRGRGFFERRKNLQGAGQGKKVLTGEEGESMKVNKVLEVDQQL
jgi:hypothetical protein